jgi:cytochrome c
MSDSTSRPSNRPISFRLIATLFLAAMPRAVFAEPAPNSAAGHKIAQQYCAECHVIAPYGKRGWTDAPAFDAIAKQRGTTAQTLITFIQRPHMHMVNTGRPPEEAADIAAYILTLRKH